MAGVEDWLLFLNEALEAKTWCRQAWAWGNGTMQGSQRFPSSWKEVSTFSTGCQACCKHYCKSAASENPVMLPLKGTVSSYIIEGLYLSSFPLSCSKSHAWIC